MSIKRFFPDTRPTLDLNFAATRRLDPRITYTRASAGTFVGSDGLIQSAAVNQARFEHNPVTGESLGLLVEEARTNIIVSSSVFDSGGWNQDGIVLTANAGVAPDGTTTATSVSQGTGSNRSFHFDNSGVTGSKVFSFFAKANAGASVQVEAVGGQSPNATVTVNLSNGTVSGFTGATIQPYANGWYRVFLPVTVTLASSDSTYWQIFGPASSVFAWGAQLEAGAFPTSYIPTVASTVTRAADVASITGANFSSWYNQSQGTLIATTPSGIALGIANQTYFGTSTGTINANIGTGNGIKYGSGSPFSYTRFQVIASSAAQADSNSAINASKIALAYATNNFALVRGGSLFTDTSGDVPTGMDTFTIRGVGSQSYSRMAYYPVRLPDATLQALTAT
jgi:hypothetical protein